MSRTLLPLVAVLAWALLAPSSGLAQSDPPSGGGYGCKSNGNCEGTLYKDKSNLDKWWYKECSNCHRVQAPPPPDVQSVPTRFQRDLVANKQRFWAFHAAAETDPVLRRLTPRTRMVPVRDVPSPYRELLNR